MKSIFVAAFLALASGGGCSLTPAMAQSPHGGECHQFAPLYDKAKAEGWMQVDVKGADLVRLMKNYNAVEPVSDIHPDRVLISNFPGEDEIHLIFVDKGCLLGAEVIDEKELIRLLTTEVGNPA